ncbi:MAG TPA: hypothetical protein PLL20_21520, partial [Phycisphaerae bacterium]|nr:hypothetical protein [Phycisphaerae bacterium]
MCRSFNRTAIVLAVLSLGFGADAIFWLGGPPGTGSQVLALNLDDPCKDVECPECYVCVDGTCVYNCDDETDATSGDPCPDAPPWPEVPTSGLTAPAGDIPPLPPPELPPCPDPDQPPDVQLCAASVGSSGSTHGCGGGGVSAGGGGAPCQEDSEQDPAPPSYNQDPPAQTGGGGSGKGSIGDGVYLNLSKGQVGASVHVLETYAYGSTELSLTLYYDSRSAYVNTVFGAYGWSHSFFGRVEEKLVEGTVVKVTFWYGRFQRIYFLWNGQTFVTANGRRDILTRVGSHYEITMEDGVHLVFDDEGRLTERTDVHDLVTRYYYSNGRLVKVVTPHGREIQFEYDTNGRLETIIGPDARETTLTYDPSNGNLIRVTDPTMHSTSYEYDSWHRMTKETLKDNRYYTIEYSSYLDKRTIKDSEGNVVASVSSAAGFPSRRDESALSAISPGNVTVVDGRGATWTLYRDDKGRITSIVSPNNYTRSVTYGGDNDGYQSDRIVSVTNERNLTEQYTYTAYGRLATERNRANQLWSYSYHPSKPSLLTIITEPDTDQWVYAYDSHGRVTQITDPLIETPTDAVTTITYEYYGSTEGVPSGNDPLPNRIKKYTQTDVNGHVMVCECDYQGNITKMTRGYGTGLLNLVTRCEYDPLGRRTRRIIERGDRETIVQWVRDEVGRVTTSIDDPGTGALNLTTSYVYDGEGHLKEVTNPRGHKTKFDYDHRGRAVKRTVAYGSLNLETHWTYDGNGNVETITDANNNTTTFTYNAQNFLISVLDPENYQTIFTRDGVGNATRIDRTLTTNPNGDKYSVSQTFDNINRRLTQTVAPETLALTTQFDYTDGGCACRWRPHKITSPDNKITYLYYDKLDRLVKLVRKVTDTADNGGDTDDIIYQRELDPVGNVTAVVLPEGERTEYEYDEANRLVEETRIGPSSTTIVTTATYDGADNLRVVTLPNNNQVTRTYDAVNRLDTVYDSVGAILDLGYDANSNITSRADGLNHTWQYQYDQADRPVKLYDPLVEGGTDKYTSLTYDGLGNRLTATDNNGIITGFEYDKLSRLTKTVEHKNGTGDTANTQTVYT